MIEDLNPDEAPWDAQEQSTPEDSNSAEFDSCRHPTVGSGNEIGESDDKYPVDDDLAGDPTELIPGRGGPAVQAQTAVEDWHIRSVGHRPMDFMARDCLFASLLRDYRVPWFRRYLAQPLPWIESLVSHLRNKADRTQALRHVVLHFLHKLHLARLLEYHADPEHMYDADGRPIAKTLKRLWNCTPYGVEVERVGRPGKPRPGCNLPRLCPWCHARKVVQLYDILSKGPLRNPEVRYLFFGKARPFAERTGGVNGRWHHADMYNYTHGDRVRGYFGRYFGRQPERLRESRDVLVECLNIPVMEIGFGSGLWTHQLGSAELENGRRTFLHDLALIAQVTDRTLDIMPKDDEGKIFWGGRERIGLPDIEANLEVLWLPLPMDKPAALRVALAGSSVGFAVSQLDLPAKWFEGYEGQKFGIPGALSWQPTFLFDDQMWEFYAQAVKGQPLYHPFGSWKTSMAGAAADIRRSIDRRFERAQARRFYRARQQRGNRRRGREVQDRRAELLTVALELWPRVIAEPSKGRGRPGHRKKLAELLDEQGLQVSRRDLDWLMQQLRARG